MMKKLLIVLFAVLMLSACTPSEPVAQGPTPLPATIDTAKKYKPSKDAEETACVAGVYAAACSSISKDNVTDFYGRDDVIYIDLRDYTDYAKKHIKNFEVVPYFAVIFNKDAGTEGKPQLYHGTVDEPVATYEQSDSILAQLFPKDKVIFLMCQSGGRVAQCMKLLAAKGYDMTKIYNVGGMGQYTDAKFRPFTTDTAELVANVTYNFEGLTLAQ